MTGTILEKIISAKRARIAEALLSTNIVELSRAAFERRKNATPNRMFNALRASNRINIIAEIKRASPSKGAINESADIKHIAHAYERGGACAVSVLTEEDHFRGSIEDLKSVRSTIDLPILQKDFFVDEFQIFESAAAGADAILLIAAALSAERIANMQKVANDLGLDAIVEVHSADEMNIAVEAGANLIGVNNRDLRTFEVSLDVSREVALDAPKNAILIAESGISNATEIVELRKLGFSGFLMGETLMRSPDPEQMVRYLASESADIIECSTTQ